VELAWIDLVGAVAGVLTTTAFIPQALKTIRTRNTSGLSLTMYALLLTGVMLWLAYGIVLGSWPLIVSNAVALLPQSVVLWILLRQQWTR
jgi:MtN3 and saliva related transmembrane protein